MAEKLAFPDRSDGALFTIEPELEFVFQKPGYRFHHSLPRGQRSHIDVAVRFPGATHRNIYVDSQAAAETKSIQSWIEKHLRLQVNPAKSGTGPKRPPSGPETGGDPAATGSVVPIGFLEGGTGRTWERKFLGFQLTRMRRIIIAPESVERFKAKVREVWRSCQSLTEDELRKNWQQYLRGWWRCYQLSQARQPIFQLEPWIRRHIRKFFWLRRHGPVGRRRNLRSLGWKGHLLKVARSSQGAWHIARTGSLQTALSNAVLRRSGFLLPSDLAAP